MWLHQNVIMSWKKQLLPTPCLTQDYTSNFLFSSSPLSFLSSADALITSATYGASILSRACLFERHTEVCCSVCASAFFFLPDHLFLFCPISIIITNNESWVKFERIKPEEVKTCSNGADVADGSVLHILNCDDCHCQRGETKKLFHNSHQTVCVCLLFLSPSSLLLSLSFKRTDRQYGH